MLDAAAGVPPALDPDMPAPAALPAARRVHVAGALALVVALAPDPPVLVPGPAPIDIDEAGADVVVDDARRRRLLLDLDDRNGRTTDVGVTGATNHATN